MKLSSGLHRLYSGLKYALAACSFAAVLFTAGQIESQAQVSATWNFVSLNSDGDCSWNVSYPTTEAVDRYEITLAREKNGTWNYSYKTYKTTDTSYNISFSSTGKYYITVKAKFVGGDYSNVSLPSNTVAVTSDDIDTSSSSGGGTVVYVVPGSSSSTTTIYSNQAAGPGGTTVSTGTTYVVQPAGPGPQSTTTTVSTTGSSQTIARESGWVKVNGGYMYRYGNGTYPAGAWDRIDNNWYYFDTNGLMHVGWLYLNDKWYYCLPSGKMAASSWNNINGKWYYFNESGIMQKGYITLDGKTYYTDTSGARVDSAYNPDGHLFDLNGVMVS